LAEANGMTKKFQNFFFHNGQDRMWFACVK
jgi:hypothetical protein